jgi:uncharacterized double-CXXCG motif protein
MKLYRLKSPDDAPYEMFAHRKWLLPGVRCEYCEAVWTSIGLDYPSVDLSGFPGEAACRAGVISVGEYQCLRRELLQWLSRPLLVRPGTGFGPLGGRVRGVIHDIAWAPGSSTLLFTQDVFEAVRSKARGVRGQRSLLKGQRKDYGELIELDLEPCAELHPSVVPFDVAPPCEECGWWNLKMPEKIVLKAPTIPHELDVFRGMNVTNSIFATERFVEALQSRVSSGFLLQEVAAC